MASGDHALDCATCHTDEATFKSFSCVSCHAHARAPTDLVHNSVADYTYASPGCYGCHPAPARRPFPHNGISGDCALCHDVGGSFAALPRPGFTHFPTTGTDCGTCHVTSGWATAAPPSFLVRDPARDVTVTGLVPSYAGTSIVALTPRAQVLPMNMDHRTAAIDATALGNCGGCHPGAFDSGALHAPLAGMGAAQPATCLDCHAASVPVGFVGPLATVPARSPASGEMKHDAVAWSNGAPTATRIVTADCAVCHVSPSGTPGVTWATGPSGAGVPEFHASLDAALLARPATCLDCHASSRPGALLTSSAAALPPGVTFDHLAPAALGECATCHAASAGAGWVSWAGGRHHLAGDADPSTCLPCHEGERPVSDAGWTSATYTASPFDYGTNAAGITHGDGQDCAGCHPGPGTGGVWGGMQSWVGGHFPHGPDTVAATTCISCHMSQRPDLLPGTTPAEVATALGFDHVLNGTGDCFGCHQATVTAGRYLDYFNPLTRTLPGGDWAGGEAYPGATLVSAPDSVVTLPVLTLTRSGPLVTGFTTRTATLYGAMSHVSAAIPAAVSPGPPESPDMTTCWHCHTHVDGTVTSYANGSFHASLTGYTATPGGAVTPLPQPTSRCADCHAAMRPTGIVELAGSDLSPMDHAALFTGPATIGGATVSGAGELDCAVCHARTDTWADGAFHAPTGSAVPADCTVCHYPLMATATADVASGVRYVMSHRSALITEQRCDTCHATALARSTLTPVAATLWQTGAYHAGVTTQPAACLDCHAVSVPPTPTQSSVVYTLASGGTASNGAQWMSHAATDVVGVDCAACHAGDARATGAAWSKDTAFHARVANPGSCQACHGLTNGNGPVAGTGNNLPFGLTDSSTLTTASDDPTTGIPAGTHDQIHHADVNVSGNDCGICHTQVGPSTVAGVQGREWAQAMLHTSFPAGAPLVTNGTTGRCSNCHMNLKPGTSFVAQDHSTFTDVPGSQDCGSCHTWPGTGTASAPNWLGGGAAPQLIIVGGFTIPDPPSTPPAPQAGIPGLPHPSTAFATCATCHAGGAGGKGAIGYDHASPLIATSCTACHEAGSDLVGAVWNGALFQVDGEGDTRPFTLLGVSATYKSNTTFETTPNHFFLDRAGNQVDCHRCHAAPLGISTATVGAAYRAAWAFVHPPEEEPPTSDVCWQCHVAGRPGD